VGHGKNRDQPSGVRRHRRELAPGSFDAETNALGERLIWLPRAVVDGLQSMRESWESYSDVILRLAAEG
jgi:hypothetical protein